MLEFEPKSSSFWTSLILCIKTPPCRGLSPPRPYNHSSVSVNVHAQLFATPSLSLVFLRIVSLFKNMSKDFPLFALLSLYILDKK